MRSATRTAGRADGPIALAEVQGYVFAAKRGMAGWRGMRGDEDLARRLEAAADDLRGRFEDAFWSEEQAFYVMALDGEKRQAAHRLQRWPLPVVGDRLARSRAAGSWTG